MKKSIILWCVAGYFLIPIALPFSYFLMSSDDRTAISLLENVNKALEFAGHIHMAVLLCLGLLLCACAHHPISTRKDSTFFAAIGGAMIGMSAYIWLGPEIDFTNPVAILAELGLSLLLASMSGLISGIFGYFVFSKVYIVDL